MSCERCERDIERLRGELNILRSEMIEVVGGMLARVDEVLARSKLATARCLRIFERRPTPALRACRRASTHRPGLTARTTSHRN
jgi:hypothetical protein